MIKKESATAGDKIIELPGKNVNTNIVSKAAVPASTKGNVAEVVPPKPLITPAANSTSQALKQSPVTNGALKQVSMPSTGGNSKKVLPPAVPKSSATMGGVKGAAVSGKKSEIPLVAAKKTTEQDKASGTPENSTLNSVINTGMSLMGNLSSAMSYFTSAPTPKSVLPSKPITTSNVSHTSKAKIEKDNKERNDEIEKLISNINGLSNKLRKQGEHLSGKVEIDNYKQGRGRENRVLLEKAEKACKELESYKKIDNPNGTDGAKLKIWAAKDGKQEEMWALLSELRTQIMKQNRPSGSVQ